MKFRVAVIISVILHISVFALTFYLPGMKVSANETVYYVDFIQMPGGGGGSGGSSGGAQADIKSETANKVEIQDASKGVKDLTVKKETGAKLRYPELDKKKKQEIEKAKKKINKNKRKKEELVSVVRKDKRDIKRSGSDAGTPGSSGSNIRIGTGGGSGTGTGSGYGSGSGPGGNFPYAYYIDAIKNKISSSWYSSLVTPGTRGKFVAVVYFRILRNGQITDLRLEKESGIESLDLSALRAVENAAPFPQLPSSFAYRYLGVHFEFEHSK